MKVPKLSEMRFALVHTIIPWQARVLQCAYIVVAGFGIEQCILLASTTPKSVAEKTVYVPLLACSAADFAQGNPVEDLSKCTSLKILVEAAAVSVVCSILGVVAYLVTCMLRRMGKLGNRVLSILTGLAFFLVISLLQAGVAMLAIAYFCDMFLKQAEDLYGVLVDGAGGMGGGADVRLVSSHSCIWAGGVLALVTAVATFVDALARLAVGVPGGGGTQGGRAKTSATDNGTGGQVGASSAEVAYPSGIGLQMAQSGSAAGPRDNVDDNPFFQGRS